MIVPLSINFVLIFLKMFSGEMIDNLTLKFNRTRQAVITGELLDTISGATTDISHLIHCMYQVQC